MFLFPSQIPHFNAKSRSLYAEVSVLLSKWPAFNSKILVWVCIRERRPVRLLWGVGVVARVKRVAQN